MTDANELVTREVSVTQADIDEGERGNCDKCALALALDRAIVPTHYAEVSGATVRLYTRVPGPRGAVHDYGRAKLCSDARKFVEDFDLSQKVMPNKFPFAFPARFWKEQIND